MRAGFPSIAILAASTCLTVAACSGDTPEPEDAVSAEPAMVTDAEGAWIATGSRLGPVGADTTFSLDALQAALPGFSLRRAEAFAEGMSYSVYEARRDAEGPAELVFDGDNGMLLAVRIRSAGLIDAAADIGQPAGSAGFEFGDCFPGVEERSGDVVCPDPAPNGLNYWIAVDYAGPDGELPPAETIAAGQVYEINWQPMAG